MAFFLQALLALFYVFISASAAPAAPGTNETLALERRFDCPLLGDPRALYYMKRYRYAEDYCSSAIHLGTTTTYEATVTKRINIGETWTRNLGPCLTRKTRSSGTSTLDKTDWLPYTVTERVPTQTVTRCSTIKTPPYEKFPKFLASHTYDPHDITQACKCQNYPQVTVTKPYFTIIEDWIQSEVVWTTDVRCYITVPVKTQTITSLIDVTTTVAKATKTTQKCPKPTS